ncbi:MAG: DAK2 domain-containing protein [Alicyclobacillus sp.]|nr:DAK2 domain-containing protein [Alicyclobacillus sp.]
MTVRVLDGEGFVQMIQAGHARLQAMAEGVNALNVFPVPDGDTGTNMALSLAQGVASLQQLQHPRLAGAAQALADGLLMGARGNSGVILSQLFRGFAKVIEAEESLLTADLFARALQAGVDTAYQAVARPVEGTILTVARAAAQVGVQAAREQLPLPLWMKKVRQAAAAALANTPEQLPVLKQAGVVDSGGQGLVYILEGFERWLQGMPVTAETSSAGLPLSRAGESEVHTAADNAGQNALVSGQALGNPAAQARVELSSWPELGGVQHDSPDSHFGYCTEVLLRLPTATRPVAALRQALAALGDSLVVVESGEWIKAHVHTDHPGQALEAALQYGELTQVKVENMREQRRRLQARQQRAGELDNQLGARIHVEAAQAGNRPGFAVTAQGATAGQPLAVVAVVAGAGLAEAFRSLGAFLVDGGQTMNPSTADIAAAVQATGSPEVLLLPNHKNVVAAAEQVQQLVPGQRVYVVPATHVAAGLAALTAFLPERSAADNAARMTAACQSVRTGAVVRAARDGVFDGQTLRTGQFMGFAGDRLVCVEDQRRLAAAGVIQVLAASAAELVTVFYSDDVPPAEAAALAEVVQALGLALEVHYGGQPVYDYIFSVE